MKKKMCAVCAVIGVMLLGSATAFFTDQGSAANEFIVGNVSVDLTEPGWNPDDGTALTPNKTVKKDPQVTNTGSNDAFVFLQVKVPTASVKTAAVCRTAGSRICSIIRSTAAGNWWISRRRLMLRFILMRILTQTGL